MRNVGGEGLVVVRNLIGMSDCFSGVNVDRRRAAIRGCPRIIYPSMGCDLFLGSAPNSPIRGYFQQTETLMHTIHTGWEQPF